MSLEPLVSGAPSVFFPFLLIWSLGSIYGTLYNLIDIKQNCALPALHIEILVILKCNDSLSFCGYWLVTALLGVGLMSSVKGRCCALQCNLARLICVDPCWVGGCSSPKDAKMPYAKISLSNCVYSWEISEGRAEQYRTLCMPPLSFITSENSSTDTISYTSVMLPHSFIQQMQRTRKLSRSVVVNLG